MPQFLLSLLFLIQGEYQRKRGKLFTLKGEKINSIFGMKPIAQITDGQSRLLNELEVKENEKIRTMDDSRFRRKLSNILVF